ncbi:amino acid ABC transporter substrate-binding protein [Crocosphaera sp. UHCC 0190]|uniref:amino acid ABC transporter substrate-binding protein n=1 Tax=Crocosphaera sp. UHCC 0190 TaxID=3110246 RepID=UPI002B1EE8FD|nr:amino acid ABC transporter substrate-binding protein [Crocosphaera sp. UHCC 0190]MEA5512066.1 amino acid ABC transporter substrate-binding protein [Crocosphaera sp. UHCC 0190]
MFNLSKLTTKLPSLILTTSLLILPLTACNGGKTTNGNTTGENSQTTNSRLEIVKQRGNLICGVNGEVPGFSFVDEKGQYSGLDVDVCRAIAAALFGDATKVEYRKLSAQERFSAVQSGEVDVLSRNTTWTLSRDTANGMEFAPTVFYDGQGLMVTKASGVSNIEGLAGKSICVLAGTTTEQNLADQMRKRGVKNYNPVVSDDVDTLYAAYQEGRCEGVTADRSQLVARRSILPKPDDHVILDVVLSKEPLGPAVKNGDSAWFDAVKWITFALFEGEELGITSQNVDKFETSEDPNVRRFLGLDDKLGEGMGLPNNFATSIIKQVGNYGEIYDRNIGKPLGLERGPNKLWTDGGLLYSPPFR